MFGLFGKKKNKADHKPELADMDHNPLKTGDMVECFRYDLGKSKLVEDAGGKLVYESLDTGKQVSWALMVDAATRLQKVKKIS